MKPHLLTFALILALCAPASSTQVGPTPDGGTVVSTKQIIHPAGKSVEFNGRPVDLVLSPDCKVAYVKERPGTGSG